jgi:ketosteroid isomerase-like protein
MGTVVIGQAAIRALLQSLTTAATEIKMNVVRVVALHGIALVYNDWKSKTASEDGRVRESSGKAIEFVRRQPDGRWLFAIDDPFGRSRSG